MVQMGMKEAMHMSDGKYAPAPRVGVQPLVDGFQSLLLFHYEKRSRDKRIVFVNTKFALPGKRAHIMISYARH